MLKWRLFHIPIQVSSLLYSSQMYKKDKKKNMQWYLLFVVSIS